MGGDACLHIVCNILCKRGDRLSRIVFFFLNSAGKLLWPWLFLFCIDIMEFLSSLSVRGLSSLVAMSGSMEGKSKESKKVCTVPHHLGSQMRIMNSKSV